MAPVIKYSIAVLGAAEHHNHLLEVVEHHNRPLPGEEHRNRLLLVAGRHNRLLLVEEHHNRLRPGPGLHHIHRKAALHGLPGFPLPFQLQALYRSDCT